MCRSEVPTTVRLHVGGGSFYCPVCKHSRRHPPSDPELSIEGHVCCEVCATVMRIEGVRAPLERPAGRDDARPAPRPFYLYPFWP